MRRVLVSSAITLLLAASLDAAPNSYIKTNLVSDQAGVAAITDPNLVNPWGIAMSATSPFWVADNQTSSATLYGGDTSATAINKNALTVTIPGGLPTGTVFNGSSDFVITSGGTGPARFIFASQTGNIDAWRAGTTAVVAAAQPGHVYTGLAIGNNGVSNFLYAADFANGAIDVYNTTFALTALAGTFTDPALPAGYKPFNIQNLGGTLFVAYAPRDPITGDEVPGAGNGIVDRFDSNGNFLGRLITAGTLNDPWGMTIAPSSFGPFGGALLVGYFGDGRINVFNSTTGAFLGTLNDTTGTPISIDGLWGLTFGNGVGGGDVNSLYFAAGPNGETHGLFGRIAVAGFVRTNLVSDQSGVALITDPSLVNPWGIALSATSPFWVADNVPSQATIYGGDTPATPFNKNALTVNIPGGLPTGTVFNGSADFVITSNGTGPARFLFASQTGNIDAWRAGTAAIVAASHPGRVYTGLAIGNNGVSNFLYAADFANGAIDVHNTTFALTALAGTFTDPALLAGYKPFNIQNLGGTLFVAYAPSDPITGDEVPGASNGIVDRFDANGNFLGRLITGGVLNDPWGMTIAPAGFGPYAGALLVGNFGDGRINAFNSTTGLFLGTLTDILGEPIVIDGLWAITFGNGVGGGSTNTLYFTAGPNNETHGLFGKLAPATAVPTINATGVAIVSTEGSSFSGNVASFTDSDGVGTYSVTINWGDSTTSAGTVTATGSGGFRVQGTHTYAEETAPAGVPVVVTITDTSIGTVGTANGTAIVSDVPLTGTPVAISAAINGPFSGAVANFTDADPAGIASDYTATIDWGDGTPTSAGTIAPSGGGFVVNGTHQYTTVGPRTVTVTITDAGGATTTVLSSAAVSATIPALGPLGLLALGLMLATIGVLRRM